MSSTSTERPVSVAHEAEQALIGALLLDGAPVADVARVVHASDFSDARHQHLFGAVVRLSARGAPIDFVSVSSVLQEDRLLEEVGGHHYMVLLAEQLTTSAHAMHHAGLVAQYGQRRRALALLRSAASGLEHEHLADTAGFMRLLIADLEGIAAPGPGRCNGQAGAQDVIQTVSLAEVEPRPVVWLWANRIALGKLTLLVGDPGLGKSTLALDVAARVSRGASWPDVPGASPPGRVLIATAEDALDDVVRPRLEAVGAKLENVSAITAVRTKEGSRGLSLEADLPALERALDAMNSAREVPSVRVLLIDPVTAFLGSTDSHKNADVRAVLAPLSALAEKYGIAVVVITHQNKGQAAAIYRALGSIAFVAAARAVWFVAKDKEDPGRRLLLEGKNNLGHAEPLAFRLDAAPGPGGTTVPAVAWENESVTTTLEEALAPAEDGTRSELERASDFLRSELASAPVAAAVIQQGARANGIAERTLNRAKKELGVRVSKAGFGGGWAWSLSEGGEE